MDRSLGVSDSVLFGGGDILTYALGADPTGEIIADSFLLNVRVNLGADDATISARFSTDLVNWVPSAGVESRVNNGDGTETFLYQSPFPAGTTPKQFGSVVVESE